MAGPATGPRAGSGAAAPRGRRTLLRVSLALGTAVLVLLGLTAVNVRANESQLFEPSLEELRSVPDEHGVTKDGYAATSRAVADASRARDAVADSVRTYYLALLAGDAEIEGAPELLAALDQAAASTENLPALANPEVAALKDGYDEVQRAYREDLDALLADAAALHGAGACHPTALAALDPGDPATQETVQGCRDTLEEVGAGSSPVADIAAAGVPYLDYWARALAAGDVEAAAAGSSAYLAAFGGAADLGISTTNRMDEAVDGEGNDLVTYCDRRSALPAGS